MLDELIDLAFREDIGKGDHSTLACVEETATGSARLIVKEPGIIAGVELAQRIFERFDPDLRMKIFIHDGNVVKTGDIAFEVSGSSRSILTCERLVLNFMQRMSGIATKTRHLVDLVEGTGARLLDTRKTTPGLRYVEKWAVRIGGGHNHRFGLYDMIMLKDNHVDYAGGIGRAIEQTGKYLAKNKLDLRVEVEVRNLIELKEVIDCGGVDRILLDNFSPEELRAALEIVPEGYETEASGGITEKTIRSYAETGVNYISVGALTHSVKSLDLSLKAFFNGI